MAKQNKEHYHIETLLLIGFLFFLIFLLFWINFMQTRTISNLIHNSDNYYSKNLEKCLDKYKYTTEIWKENEDCFNWACSQLNMTSENGARNFMNGNIKCYKNGVSFYVSVDFSTPHSSCYNYVNRQYLFERCYYEY